MTSPVLTAGACFGIAAALMLGQMPSVAADPVQPPPLPGLPALVSDPEVHRLQAPLNEQEEQLRAVRAQAAAAVAACREAAEHAAQARRRAEMHARALARSRIAADAARQSLARYVGTLYRTGMVSRSMPIYLSLMGSDRPRAALAGLALAERVGQSRGNVLVQLQEAEAMQTFAAERAAMSQAAAQAARRAAAAAVVEAGRLLDLSAAMAADRESAPRGEQSAAAPAQEQTQEQTQERPSESQDLLEPIAVIRENAG